MKLQTNEVRTLQSTEQQMLHIKNISPSRITPPILSAQYYKQNTQTELFLCARN